MDQYDLIIVGGGLVGAGLAIALQSDALRIALIDARNPSCNDPRLFALNASSCQFLENLGLWPLLHSKASPIHQVHVSYQQRFGSVRLRREDIALDSLGYVVPAYCIETALHEALSKLPNIDVFRPAKLKSLSQHDDMNTLVIDAENSEFKLFSPIVIGADGTDSMVRSQMGIPIEEMNYNQSAIVTRTTLQRSHQHIAFERFTTTGAIAMLPLSDCECATIWSTETEYAQTLMTMNASDFTQILQKEFSYRLGKFQADKERHIFSLRKVCAEKTAMPGILLIGNAAHTLHPVAAQGFNLAIYEIAVIVESISKKLFKNNGRLHPTDVLSIDETIRKQQQRSVRFSHQLVTWVSKQSRVFSVAFQLGMVGMDACLPLKKYFIQQMMGRTECVPQLLLKTSELVSTNGL